MKYVVSLCLLLLPFEVLSQIKAEEIDKGTLLGSTGKVIISDYAAITKYKNGTYRLSCSKRIENIYDQTTYEIKIKNKKTLDDFYSLMIQGVNDKKDFKFSISAGETIYLEYFPLSDQVILTVSLKTKEVVNMWFTKTQVNELFGK